MTKEERMFAMKLQEEQAQQLRYINTEEGISKIGLVFFVAL